MSDSPERGSEKEKGDGFILKEKGDKEKGDGFIFDHFS